MYPNSIYFGPNVPIWGSKGALKEPKSRGRQFGD